MLTNTLLRFWSIFRASFISCIISAIIISIVKNTTPIIYYIGSAFSFFIIYWMLMFLFQLKREHWFSLKGKYNKDLWGIAVKQDNSNSLKIFEFINYEAVISFAILSIIPLIFSFCPENISNFGMAFNMNFVLTCNVFKGLGAFGNIAAYFLSIICFSVFNFIVNFIIYNKDKKGIKKA